MSNNTYTLTQPPSSQQQQSPNQTTTNPLPQLPPQQQQGQLLYTPETLTIPDVISKLESICLDYPNQIDSSLYQLNLFSVPSSIISFFDDNFNSNAQLSIDQIPETKYQLLQSSILQCCQYIITNHYPYRDDACELFIIQAQAIARYCHDWNEYPKILKYTTYAQKCDPNPIQQQRIYKLEEIAYGYKLKAFTETTLYNIFKTWFGFHTVLATINYLFPFAYSPEELRQFKRFELGVMRNYDGTELYRDITPYTLSRNVPVPELASEHANIIDTYEKLATHAQKYNKIPRRATDPAFGKTIPKIE